MIGIKMTIYEQTAAKIQQLPDPLVREVGNFIDFLLLKQDNMLWQLWNHFHEILDLAESDFSDYLENLESYEESLAHGEIKWE
jgi:hypothetical protein